MPAAQLLWGWDEIGPSCCSKASDVLDSEKWELDSEEIHKDLEECCRTPDDSLKKQYEVSEVL